MYMFFQIVYWSVELISMIHGNRCNTLVQHGEGEKIIITKYKKQALRNLHKKIEA